MFACQAPDWIDFTCREIPNRSGPRWSVWHRAHQVPGSATKTTRWRFQVLFLFTPIWGHDAIWTKLFQMG